MVAGDREEGGVGELLINGYKVSVMQLNKF